MYPLLTTAIGARVVVPDAVFRLPQLVDPRGFDEKVRWVRFLRARLARLRSKKDSITP